MKRAIIILAGGIGSRTGLAIPKQYFKVNGITILELLISRIHQMFDTIVIVNNDKYLEEIKNLSFGSKVKVVGNGITRLESIKNGLKQLTDEQQVFIHEAARPLVDEEIMQWHIDALKKHDVNVCGLKSNQGVIVNGTFNSHKTNEIFVAMLPQSYNKTIINKYWNEIQEATGDLDILEIISEKINVIETDFRSEKITTSNDLEEIIQHL